jgi:NAD-dependent SIR2 family protein deacetylase
VEEKQRKIALLTGAGSTMAFGMPGMYDFITDLLNHTTIKAEGLDALINDSYHSRGRSGFDFDLEQMLTKIKNLLTYYEDGLYSTEIRETILHNTPKGVETISSWRELYKKNLNLLNLTLVRIVNVYSQDVGRTNVFIPIIQEISGIDVIFTTNYDLILEKELEKSPTPFIDGFENKNGRNVWVGQKSFSDSRNAGLLKLFKLHGSVNWYKEKHSWSIIKSESHGSMTADAPYENTLIYPYDKSFRRYVPFGLMLEHFTRSLLSIDFLIVIGFSMRDHDINDIIKFALSENPRLKIIIWDPNPGQVTDNLVRDYNEDPSSLPLLKEDWPDRIITFESEFFNDPTKNSSTLRDIKDTIEDRVRNK